MRNILVAAGVLLAPLTSSALENAGNAELGQQKLIPVSFAMARQVMPHDLITQTLMARTPVPVQCMKAYKTGERSGAMGNMMKQQMSVLNDQDMKDIAAYYAEQNPGKPE